MLLFSVYQNAYMPHIKNKYFTIQEAASILGVKERAVQARCSRYGLKKINGRYSIPQALIEQWGGSQTHTSSAQPNAQTHIYGLGQHEQADGTYIQVFTKDEYKQFEDALIERNELKIELREMQKRLEQLQQWKEDFMRYTSQRNTIEAHEKGVIASTIEDIEEVESEEILQKHLSDKRKIVLKDKAKFSDWLQSLE